MQSLSVCLPFLQQHQLHLAYPGTGSTQVNRFRILGNGNIGMGGQLSPAAVLDVTGTGNFSGVLTSGTLSVTGAATAGSILSNGKLQSVSTAQIGYAASATITTNMMLDVNGNINFTGSLYKGGSLYVSSQWTTSGTSIYYGGSSITPQSSGSTDIGTSSLQWGKAFLQTSAVVGYASGATTASGMTLDVNGNLNYTGTLYRNGTAFPITQWTTSGQTMLDSRCCTGTEAHFGLGC